MGLSDEDIVKAATALGLLGANSHSAHRILAALCDASLGAREIGELIQREPGLSARVLKVANSAYYGHSRDISTLERALVVLGLDAVRGITAAACLDRSTARRSTPAAIDPAALVNHCVASAFAAEGLARRSGRAGSAEAFMASLLHDFGIPVQERLDTRGVTTLIQALQDQPDADPSALERSLVQIGHGHCAEVIFERWQLPPLIVMAARHHADPASAPAEARELATLVHLSLQLAIDAGFTHPLEPRQHRVAREPLLATLGLTADDLPPILEPLAERVLLLAQTG
jgi:HD-like signal output (HDOD) protein